MLGLPVGDASSFLVASLTQPFVADVPTAQVGQKFLGLGERMPRAGSTRQAGRLACEEAVKAQTTIERVASFAASAAGEIGPLDGQRS
jgi:hypothetical protein